MTRQFTTEAGRCVCVCGQGRSSSGLRICFHQCFRQRSSSFYCLVPPNHFPFPSQTHCQQDEKLASRTKRWKSEEVVLLSRVSSRAAQQCTLALHAPALSLTRTHKHVLSPSWRTLPLHVCSAVTLCKDIQV